MAAPISISTQSQFPTSPETQVSPLSAADISAAQQSPLLAPMPGSLTSRLIPPFPFSSDPTPATVLQALEDAEDDAPLSDGNSLVALILRHALAWAVAHADVELVGYLAGLEGRWASILDEQVPLIEDDEGWGIVGQAIQSSCGLSDKEEAVRLIVLRWGVAAGPRGGRDHAGWTSLHLAALLSTPQIVSVLLNRGASPAALTDSGLSAYDLITGMEGRESLAVLLDPLHDEIPGVDTPRGSQFPNVSGTAPYIYPQPPLSATRTELIQRRRYRVATRGQREERRQALTRIKAERERWVRERAKNIGVNSSVLFPAPKPRVPGDEDDDEEEQTTTDEDENVDMTESDNTNPGLVFSLNQLAFLFDILITKYPPLCQPQERRSLPANAIYLYARFAHYQCDETWLEELLDGAIERIERGVYSNGDDLAYLAFWEYNLTLLLALVKSDQPLHTACTDMNLLGMVEELINAIHVFVIRIAERKIDEILDPAMLDFESLDDFEEVRFADQWNLFRSFASRKKRETPLAAAMFSVPNSPDPRVDAIDTRRAGTVPPSPSPSSASRSISELKAEARDVIATGLEKAQAVLATGDKPSPRRIVDVLTNVLLILQLYDVNPAFIVQVFSQTFYWISSELFNRIITRRKYLCRTKAVQIRMNITSLEDWTRQNGLPPNIATKHLEPVMQLLQWLQCLSQINEFDMLIGTVQNLRALNPLQMRRAVRDYRFEVDEGRMADDCVQYLAQMQKDWEKRRVHIGVKTAQSQRGVDVDGGESMAIEALFDDDMGLGDWMPQSAPECLGELVDSRFMLPFLVPNTIEYLMATPPENAAYRNLMTDGPLLPDGSIPSRPLSHASFSSSKPMRWVSPHERRVRQLPEDFFTWLKDRQAEFVRAWGGPKRDKEAKDGEKQHVRHRSIEVTPTRAAPPPPKLERQNTLVPSGTGTPNKALPRVPERSDSSHSTPSQAHARKASTDMALRRAREDMTPPGSEPIELIARSSPAPLHANGSHQPLDINRVRSNGHSSTASSPSPVNGQAHHELVRLRKSRERKASVSSVNSMSSSGGSDKKRWWKLNKNTGGSINGMPEPEERDRDRQRRAEREGTSETMVAVPSPKTPRDVPTPPHRSSTSETVTPARKHSSSTSKPARIHASPAVEQSVFETPAEMRR